LGLKRNYLKRPGQDSSATELVEGEMGCDTRLVWEGETRQGKKSILLWEIRPKDLS
jgi:hypothetical protein